MDDQRKPSNAIAMSAAWICLATLSAIACAQHPIPQDTQHPDLHSSTSLDLGLHPESAGQHNEAEPRLLLADAIEPVSFRLLRETHDSLAQTGASAIAAASDDEDLRLSPTVSMNLGRNSALLDGGIAAQRGVTSDPLRGFAGADGDFDLYNLSLRWAALSPGPIELGLLGGVRAIQSVGGMWRTEVQPAGPADRSAFTETYDQDRSTVTLPVVGGDLRLRLTDGVTLSTSATTHSSGSSDTFFDMVMETSFDLGSGIGFHAGYQEVRSVFDESGLAEPISQSGLFARLTIQF
ncbi:MAG: hypothetical protein ACI89L_001749 [Phycisphaerales bacterium]|jgi:hypothetical protein